MIADPQRAAVLAFVRIRPTSPRRAPSHYVGPARWRASQLVCFACDWAVDLSLSLSTSEKPHTQQLVAQITSGPEAALASAIATVGGHLPADGALTSQLPADAGSLQQPHAVTFFSTAPSEPEPSAAAAAAVVRLRGSVHGRAFCLAKGDVASALADLRQDVVRSLGHRISLLVESLDEDAEGEGEGDASRMGLSLEGAAAHALPRRAHIDVGHGLSLCDHLDADEDYTDCSERFRALLGVTLPQLEPDSAEAETLLGPEVLSSAEAVEAVGAALLAGAGGSRATVPASDRSTKQGGPAPSATGSAAASAPEKPRGSMLMPLAAVGMAILVAAIAAALSITGGGGASPASYGSGGGEDGLAGGSVGARGVPAQVAVEGSADGGGAAGA